MDGFISAVVLEEEKCHDVQDDNDDDESNDGNDMDDVSAERRDRLVGIRRSLHSIEALRKQQQKASRRKVLQAIRPRLEILQNLPFFIPFETRVQIFKEFIRLDQHRRRGGHVDPDNWRMSLLQNPLPNHGEQAGRDIISRHQAKIRRDNVFEDAFQQFYSLGEGLKEPIQITFVDKFDTVEAGIDGGGVTKEFLTTVTHEAFSTSDGPNLFVENDQNLLYPNPTAVEELENMLRDAKIQEGSREWNEPIRDRIRRYEPITDLLRRYEFLGRVIGKCMYEGILVDIGFAPFFLLKWALTGGSGSASRESSYRANINDLRDLDEGLYQGLVSLHLSLSTKLFSHMVASTQELCRKCRRLLLGFHHH
jgi:ubiquitin-protein ligase E3 C